MNCHVIQDLLVLYSDGCCSSESRTLVEEHLQTCGKCKKAYDELKSLSLQDAAPAPAPEISLKKIDELKASVIQSIVMFLSFVVLTVGVPLEAYTPSGAQNGRWAFSLIIPAAGLLLSLPNWYFLRFFSDRTVFSSVSMLITILLSLCGFVWGLLHYGVFSAEHAFSYYLLIGAGVLLAAACCVISKALSNKYAVFLGKE